MLLIGAVIIAAIVGVAFLATQHGGYPGSIVFAPTTVTCSSQPLTTTVKLPSSLKATDSITVQLDGATVSTQSVADYGLTQQSDGTWYKTTTSPSECSTGAGTHTHRILDSAGHVLAQGSFTLVAGPGQSPSPTAKASSSPSPTAKASSSPSPTPEPLTQSSITIEPSSFSCSGSDVDVTLTVVLSASIPGSAMITPESDGTTGTPASVESAFDQQSDGSWLETDTNSSSDLCTQYDVGQHTISALDATGHLIAKGTFTVMP